MGVVKEYTILVDFTPSGLVDQVNEKVIEGWQPWGGVSLAVTHPEGNEIKTVLAQSMVR